VPPPDAKLAELEYRRERAVERINKPAPPEPPKLSPNPTVPELVDMVRKAKEERAKDFAAGQRWHTYDPIMASWLAFGIPDALISGTLSRATVHASMYLGARIGWMKFARSPMGMEWMTRITKADMDMIGKTLAKYPEERGELGKAITDTMVDMAKAGGPPMGIAKFQGIMSPQQTQEVIKAVEAKKTSPQSSAEAGGSGTESGAAADNEDIAQARKNLGLAPGQWDNRLLSEAQKLKDARTGPSSSTSRELPKDFKIHAEPTVSGADIEMRDASGKTFGSAGVRGTEDIDGRYAMEVGNIQIDEAHIGKGYGQALYREAARHAQESGESFLVSSRKPTPAATEAWKRLQATYPDEIKFRDGRWEWDVEKREVWD
jgi:GNAT superfamily N-acetyltransferase